MMYICGGDVWGGGKIWRIWRVCGWWMEDCVRMR